MNVRRLHQELYDLYPLDLRDLLDRTGEQQRKEQEEWLGSQASSSGGSEKKVCTFVPLPFVKELIVRLRRNGQSCRLRRRWGIDSRSRLSPTTSSTISSHSPLRSLVVAPTLPLLPSPVPTPCSRAATTMRRPHPPSNSPSINSKLRALSRGLRNFLRRRTIWLERRREGRPVGESGREEAGGKGCRK